MDILAVDGYNWGSTHSYSGWKDFDTVFESSYSRITALDNDKPFWIAEVASTEQGGNKAKWIQDMFTSTAFPNLRGYYLV